MIQKIQQHFQKKHKGLAKHWDKKHLRTLLTVLGIVMVWRGVWALLDVYLFPNNLLLSYIASIILGLLILYIPDYDLKELE